MSKYIVTIDKNLSNLYHSGIKGMKWGRRRFQNEDGTLTELGKKRYGKQTDAAYDKAYNEAANNASKNPKNTAADISRIASERATSAANRTEFDVGKEVQKDLDATNTILRESGNVTRTSSNAIRNMNVKVKRMDLSKMTDDEMRKRIAREQLESQYDSMFNTKRHRAENGKRAVASVLDGLGTALTITGSALTIALAVKALKK